MADKVYYEWDVETMGDDISGDVLEHDHGDTLDDIENNFPLNHNESLVLVYNTGNEADGITDRSWAYVQCIGGEMRLPTHFGNGEPVPKRFHRELATYIAEVPIMPIRKEAL